MGTNFPLWKEQIYNMPLQKKQVKPIKLKGVKTKGMPRKDWSDLDKIAKYSIMYLPS